MDVSQLRSHIVTSWNSETCRLWAAIPPIESMYGLMFSLLNDLISEVFSDKSLERPDLTEAAELCVDVGTVVPSSLPRTLHPFRCP